MTELARYEPRAEIATLDPTGGRLVAWAQAASAANQLAKALSRTSFVPKDFSGNENDATAAILMGDELGLSPIASLRSIYVVHGQPAMYARTMVALVQSHGHEVWTELSTSEKVVVAGRRRGSTKEERAEWTIARAQRAGYTTNKKYASNPQEMLYAKAAAEVCRKIAADVLAGVPASVEDLELDDSATSSTVTAEREKPRTAKRKTDAPPPDEPPLDDATTDVDETETPVDETPEPITERQQKKMHATLNEIGITGRNDRLRLASLISGREIASSNDLTKVEAARIIDALESGQWRDVDPALAGVIDGPQEAS